MARKPYIRHLGKNMNIPVKEFNYIDRLSRQAQAKVDKILGSSNKGFISTNLSRYTTRFGGWEEGWRNFKTSKGIENYKKQLEKFLDPKYEEKQINVYKENLLGAMKQITGFGSVRTLKKELKDIKDVNEFEYMWEETNGRLSIEYLYARATDDRYKTYKEVLKLIRKYKNEYREKR